MVQKLSIALLLHILSNCNTKERADMEQINLPHLFTTIRNISGILVLFLNIPTSWSNIHLSKSDFYDKPHIGYIITLHSHYYGIINSGQIKIVIGPNRQISESDQDLRELAFQTDVVQDDIEDFIEGMKGIVRIPSESIL